MVKNENVFPSDLRPVKLAGANAGGWTGRQTIQNHNTMKTTAIAFALALAASTLISVAQDPAGQPPPPGGGPGPGHGVHVLPPRAMEQLKLTADQQKQLADLEAEVKAKLEKILTPEQLEQLKQMKPPQHHGGPGEGKPNAHRPPADGPAK